MHVDFLEVFKVMRVVTPVYMLIFLFRFGGRLCGVFAGFKCYKRSRFPVHTASGQ